MYFDMLSTYVDPDFQSLSKAHPQHTILGCTCTHQTHILVLLSLWGHRHNAVPSSLPNDADSNRLLNPILNPNLRTMSSPNVLTSQKCLHLDSRMQILYSQSWYYWLLLPFTDPLWMTNFLTYWLRLQHHVVRKQILPRLLSLTGYLHTPFLDYSYSV